MAQLDLFAPELSPGMIAITEGGNRIAIWPHEGDDPATFTGQLLEDGASYARAAVHNLSVCWDRSKVCRVEPATLQDAKLSLIELAVL